MSTRRSKTLPVIITIIFMVVIIYLFMNLRQSNISCQKSKTYDGGITVKEVIESTTDGKKISSMKITKTIYFADRYQNNIDSLDEIKNSIEKTLEYLGNKVTYNVMDDRIIIEIKVSKNELVLLDNITFVDNGGKIEAVIDTNTKSSSVIALSVGDNYNEGELMKILRNKGYNCK